MLVHVLRRIISFPLLASSYLSKTVKQYFLLITVGLWLCLAKGGSCCLHHNMLSTTDHLRRGLVTINHAARVITTLIFYMSQMGLQTWKAPAVCIKKDVEHAIFTRGSAHRCVHYVTNKAWKAADYQWPF